jgi:glycosyltransferase involved in cell wall biosynthesis
MKGFEELFQIYQRLVHSYPEVSLLIVGDGPDRSTYEKRAHALNLSNVHFAGFIQMEELPQFLALADVFVFPTLHDPFGAVLSEAMAAGLPVVSSIYAAATRDLVEDGVTGFCIDPKDIESSTATILTVLNMSKEKSAALTQAAYQRVLQHDIEPTAESMVKFMQSLLKAPRPHARCEHLRPRE